MGITAQIHLFTKDPDAALNCYKQWIKFSPDSKNAHFGAGYTLLLLKRYDESLEQYEAGLRIETRPESQNCVFLGIAYSRPSEDGFSNLEKAKVNLVKALLPPNQNNFFAHLFLTLIFTYENQMETARFHAREMLRIRPFFSIQEYQYQSWPSSDEGTGEAITAFHKQLLKKAGIPEDRKPLDFQNLL